MHFGHASSFLKQIQSKSKLILSNISYFHHVDKEPLRPFTLGKVLENTVEKFGDTIAVISRHQNKCISYKEILNEADRLAAGFRAIGLQKNDRIGLWAPNRTEWYIAKMASARAGLILVAINPVYEPAEMEYCINKVGIKAVLCADQFKTHNYYEHLLAIAPELERCDPGRLNCPKIPSLESIIIISESSAKKGTFSYQQILDMANSSTINDIKKFQKHIQPDDPCNIQFTSGTTGKPKAVLASHFSLANNSFFVGKRNELDRKQHKICVQVPFFHAFGTVITIVAALNHGTTLVLPAEGYSPSKSLDAIKEEKCTIIHGTPTMYVDLIQKQVERKEDIAPEIAVSGGALCSPHLFKQMLSVLNVKKVKSVYGLTETSAVIFQSLYNDDELKSTTTVGHVGDHVEAKVVNINNEIVPWGTPGELCVRGYMNTLGYWGDEDKTKEMIGNDGWLRTGDQFILEENGYGRVVGRLKDMIIRGGENIFPKEIEDFLNNHPKILETHVIGLPHERLGEEVCACVRVRDDSKVTLEEIANYCKGNIANFKIPSQLHIFDEFPKTISGKIQKFKLIEIASRNKFI